VDSARNAILVDFGGVLTSSVFAAFEEFGASIGDSTLPLTLLASDPQAKKLLSEHESGRMDAEAFERGFAQRLSAYGAPVAAEGLLARIHAGLIPDVETAALVAELRAAGHRVAVVSNALGADLYQGFTLTDLADEVVISSEVGIRKPSRRIYALACERLGVAPEHAVMIDDLQQNLDGAARIGIAGVLHTHAEDTRHQLATRFGIVG
jgi:putative hydrolase of the HAD superfamily